MAQASSPGAVLSLLNIPEGPAWPATCDLDLTPVAAAQGPAAPPDGTQEWRWELQLFVHDLNPVRL